MSTTLRFTSDPSTQIPAQRDAMVTTETWTPFADWDGDGRMDVIDTDGGFDATHWQVWLNRADGTYGIAWHPIQIDIGSVRRWLEDQRGYVQVADADLRLVEQGHWSINLPLERSRTSPYAIGVATDQYLNCNWQGCDPPIVRRDWGCRSRLTPPRGRSQVEAQRRCEPTKACPPGRDSGLTSKTSADGLEASMIAGSESAEVRNDSAGLPEAEAVRGFIAEIGIDTFGHRFAGREWSVRSDAIREPPAVTVLTLDLRDPRLELLGDLAELPLCSRIDGAGLERQSYTVEPIERKVWFEDAGQTVVGVNPLRLPEPARPLRLRVVEDAEDPDVTSTYAVQDTFLGGNAFLRIRGRPLWLHNPERVLCTCGRESDFVAAVGYEHPSRPSGIVRPGVAFFIGELALYFFACLPCRGVTVVSQAS